jgi:hypothetical protein
MVDRKNYLAYWRAKEPNNQRTKELIKLFFQDQGLKPAMANPRPSKFSNAALLQSLKYRNFWENSTKSLDIDQILARKDFSKVWPSSLIWVGHGWFKQSRANRTFKTFNMENVKF